MIDTEKMLESVERLERVFGGETRATQSIGEVKELLVNLRQAEKDAERYKEIIGDCRGAFIIAGDNEMISAIDEAMQCK